MPRLREVPQHELDVARAAAERRHAVGAAGGRVRRGVALERGVEDRRAAGRRAQRRVGVQADEQIGLVVVRDRGALVDRHVPIVVSRQQDADARAALRSPPFARRAMASVRSFSFAPFGALDAVVLAAVAGIDRDGVNRGRRLAEGRRQRRGGGCGGGVAGGGAGVAVGLAPPAASITSRVVVSTGWLVAWKPAKRGPRSTAERRRIERRGPPARGPAAPAPAAAGSATSSASASNLIVRWSASCVTVASARGVASIVRRARCAERIVADRDARNAQVADDQQARRLPEVEARVVDERERAADELDRHEPAAARSRRRRGQRDEPARHRGQRLIRRQDDRFPFVGNRDRAERFFADGQLERARRDRRARRTPGR